MATLIEISAPKQKTVRPNSYPCFRKNIRSGLVVWLTSSLKGVVLVESATGDKKVGFHTDDWLNTEDPAVWETLPHGWSITLTQVTEFDDA